MRLCKMNRAPRLTRFGDVPSGMVFQFEEDEERVFCLRLAQSRYTVLMPMVCELFGMVSEPAIGNEHNRRCITYPNACLDPGDMA